MKIFSREKELLLSFMKRFYPALSRKKIEGDWIDNFHKRHIPKNYVEPTDKEVQKIREEKCHE